MTDDANPAGMDDARVLSEHPCHGLFATAGDRLTHRHWFQDDKLMPTCERCGTPIDRDHKETGPVSWEPEKRREIVTLQDRYALSRAAMTAAGEAQGRAATVEETLSFLRNLSGRDIGVHEAATDIVEARERLGYAVYDRRDLWERLTLALAATPAPSTVSGSGERAREVEQAVQRIQMWMDDEHRTLSPGEVGAELAYDDVTTVVLAALAASRPTDAGAGLRDALKPFAALARYMAGKHGTVIGWNDDRVTYEDFRNAAAVLSTPNPPADEPWPGYTADQDKRRVVTLAKLGLMLSVMAGGEAPEVTGFDAADLYADVLMALGIEDAEDVDIALQVARDDPEGHMLTDTPKPPVDEARKALVMARDLILTIEQTSGNTWWVNADDPETAVCDTFNAVEDAIRNLTGDGAGA